MLIIGAGRVGTALHAQMPHSQLITREHGWAAVEGPAGTPIVVATRNDDLDAVLERIPTARRGDLVFIQNGMLRSWLEANELKQATRGLLFFAVARRGDAPKPGGPSPFTGPHADTLAATLGEIGLESKAVGPDAFLDVEVEKLLWNCIFGLLCEVHDVPVGQVVQGHRRDVGRLCEEMLAVCARELGVRLDTRTLTDSLCAYSLEIPDYRGAVKEWKWRNGWFAARGGEDMPFHDSCLKETGHP